ncbi:MAG: hypothetical protein Q9183_003978 [Haloplaca sp. 2 TL-2023]
MPPPTVRRSTPPPSSDSDPDPSFQSRVILYHQTHHSPSTGLPISLLSLLTEAADYVPITHLILAAVHLNTPPGNIHLNNHPPSEPHNNQLWEDVSTLQEVGIKILAMLGGAAQGTFTRLDSTDEKTFEEFYVPLKDMLRRHKFDGIDLDVEEEMSLNGIIRLIDRLRSDFGRDFIITLAPVARALQGGPHLSGFDYEALEIMRGSSIDWYNVQFYNNWGNAGDVEDYGEIVARGWKAEKVVMGCVTNPGNGHGWVYGRRLREVVRGLRILFPRFGGVMGWEYFNAVMGDGDVNLEVQEERPWRWAEGIMQVIREV